MSSYTIDHKCGSRYASTKTAWELKNCNSLGVFNKTIIPLTLVEYEIVISQLGATLYKPVACQFHFASCTDFTFLEIGHYEIFYISGADKKIR